MATKVQLGDATNYPGRSKGKGSWYRITVFACVLCGRTEEYRERMWTTKPKDAKDRFEYHETACGEHFV